MRWMTWAAVVLTAALLPRAAAAQAATGRVGGEVRDTTGARRRARNGAPARAGHEPGLDPARRRRRPLHVPHASRRPLRADGVVRSLPHRCAASSRYRSDSASTCRSRSSSRASRSASTVATAGALETTRTHVGTTVTAREIESLAVNGRNYLDLALLAPGVSRTNTGSSQRFAETSAVPGTGISVVVAAQPEQRVRRRRPVGQRRRGRPVRLVLLAGSRARVPGGHVGRARGARPRVGRRLQRRDALGHERGRRPRLRLLARRQPRRAQPAGPARGSAAPGPVRRQRPRPAGAGPRLPVRQRRGLRRIAHRLRDHRAGRGGGDQRRRSIASASPAPASARATSRRRRATAPRSRALDARVGTAAQTDASRYSLYDVESTNARTAGGLNDVSRGTSLDNADHTVAWTWQAALAERARDGRPRAVRAQPPRGAGQRPDRPGHQHLRRGQLRHRDVVADRPPQSPRRGRRERRRRARPAPREGRRRRARTTSVRIDFPGAVQGSYTFASLANFELGRYINFQQAFGEVSQSQSNPNLGVFVQDEWRLRAGGHGHGRAALRPAVARRARSRPTSTRCRRASAWRGRPATAHGRARQRRPLPRSPAAARALERAAARRHRSTGPRCCRSARPGAPRFPEVLTSFPAGAARQRDDDRSRHRAQRRHPGAAPGRSRGRRRRWCSRPATSTCARAASSCRATSTCRR